MKKMFIPFMVIVCLFFTACNKDNISPSEPMNWTYEILTPDNVKFMDVSVGTVPKYSFKANGKEGDIVMTCENFDLLNPLLDDSYTYDCGWATLKVEANQLKIHFPPHISKAPDTYEEISVSANEGKRKVHTIICLSRTFEEGEDEEVQPDPKPETLPEEAKFKMIINGFYPLMDIKTQIPAPLDFILFRITDINGKYFLFGLPDFTQYYDSIVWSADNFPDTFKVYERKMSAKENERRLTSQWGSSFFKSGNIKNHLKGYRNGKVEYETSLNLTLYDRDFLGLQWGTIALDKPQNLTYYCRLDKDYRYKVYDIVEENNAPYSKVVPMNQRHLSDSDYIQTTKKAIMTLMENNIGKGQDAEGKETLFKCLPEKGVEAELYWENKTTRMLMLHRISNQTGWADLELYYLHLEPK